MRGGLLEAETFETLRVPQHLAPLRGQGDDRTCDLLLSRHTHLQHLLGFLPRGHTAQSRQAKRQAMCLRSLTHPMALGDPEKRCHGSGTDRHADVIQPACRGGLQREVQRGAKRLTQRGRGHGVNQRGTRGSGVVREPLELENLLALQQAEGLGSQPLDEGFAGGQLIQTRPQLGSGRAALGTASGGELAHPVGPGQEAVHRHKAGCGTHFWRRQTRQNGVRALARDATTGRHKGLACRVIVGGALAHPGHGVREIVEARAGPSLLIEQGDGFVKIAAAVFEGGGRAAHHGDEAAEHVGNRVARPGRRHRSPKTGHRLQREGTWSALMVMGVKGSHGHHRARAQAKTAIDHPHETVTQGGRAQGEAPQQAGGVDADERESSHPLDDGLRARRFVDAQSEGQETQDARDSAQSDTRSSQEWQGQPDHVHLRPGHQSLHVGLKLAQTRQGRLEGFGGSVSLSTDARELFALVSIAVTSLLGSVFPLSATVCDCGELTHDALSSPPRCPVATGAGWLGLSK